MRSRAAALIGMVGLLVAAGACDDSPTGPTGLAGAWTGTWHYTAGGAAITDAVSATLSQNGSNVTGTWMASSGASGTMSFTTGAPPTGSVSAQQALLNGQVCSTTMSVSGGSVSTSNVELQLTDPLGAGLCQWAPGNRFVLTR